MLPAFEHLRNKWTETEVKIPHFSHNILVDKRKKKPKEILLHIFPYLTDRELKNKNFILTRRLMILGKKKYYNLCTIQKFFKYELRDHKNKNNTTERRENKKCEDKKKRRKRYAKCDVYCTKYERQVNYDNNYKAARF